MWTAQLPDHPASGHSQDGCPIVGLTPLFLDLALLIFAAGGLVLFALTAFVVAGSGACRAIGPSATSADTAAVTGAARETLESAGLGFLSPPSVEVAPAAEVHLSASAEALLPTDAIIGDGRAVRLGGGWLNV